ncbi:sugar transferase [Kiritimatiellota bacterium B12222]|nr:sugar transferase [Kiritimatiellota bacterium B12222]
MQTNAPWPQSQGKRLLDFFAAMLLLLILWPVMILIAIVLYFQDGFPILFQQIRPGRREELFTLIKFRTLADTPSETETPAGKIPPTPFCKFLRASGLDELPELWNILKGDMSFVGPRPLLVRYLPRYSLHQQRRHHVRPGLTGLAQVNGRNAIDWPQRLDLDVEYVETATLGTDLHILWNTILLIGRGEGTAEPGEFMGNPLEDRQK